MANPPNLTASQIHDGLWENGLYWTSPTITYSVPGAGAVWDPGLYPDGHEPDVEYSVLNAQQGTRFTNAAELWDSYLGINMNKVTETASVQGDIRVAFSGFGPNAVIDPQGHRGAWGYAIKPPIAGFPLPPDPWDGDIWIAPDNTGATFAAGSYDWMAILHELGHSLGLKHPFETPTLPAKYDNYRYTIMAYDAPADHFRNHITVGSGGTLIYDHEPVYAATPMVLDIKALQDIYGVDSQTRNGATTYHFSDDTTFLQTIYDAGGNDTFDLTNLTRGSIVDLRPGAYSSIARYRLDDQVADAQAAHPGHDNDIFGNFHSVANPYTWTDNVGIAFSTVIENLLFGGSNDTGEGNAANNTLSGGGGRDILDGRGGNDTLLGGGGADKLTGGVDKDSLTGGRGGDTFIFNAVADSKGTKIDLIKDFGAGDKIDLRGIDADTAQSGDQGFAIDLDNIHGARDLHFSFDAGHNRTVITLYINNDAIADGIIWLTGNKVALLDDPGVILL